MSLASSGDGISALACQLFASGSVLLGPSLAVITCAAWMYPASYRASYRANPSLLPIVECCACAGHAVLPLPYLEMASPLLRLPPVPMS